MTETIVYRHTPEMGEISGFGGGYEENCQKMLEAGVKWLNSKVSPDLSASTFSGVYGLLVAESDDAKELENVILNAVDRDATGAMHHAVMSRLFWIAKNGWDRYVEELTQHEAASIE